MTKTDNQLKREIEAELEFEPKINAARIAVSVDDGAVSLLGTVDTYAEKWTAEAATKRVHGVLAVAQDLKVKVLQDHIRSDSEIAVAAAHALSWDVFVPKGVKAKVEGGWVLLTGQVTWNFQRESAERAIRRLKGVSGVTNAISLRPEASVAKVREDVEAALQRQATEDAKSIKVSAKGGQVTLSGHASSFQSIDAAANAAWAAPGVTDVIDEMRMAMTP